MQIRPCIGMGYCIDSIYGGQAVCIHNAATGRQEVLPHDLQVEGLPKKIVVVGAGPGGLEAARVAAERGHNVHVFEAASRAGGQVILTAALKRRREILGSSTGVSRCERLGVPIRYNTFADASDILAEAPDCVIVATGRMPNLDLSAPGRTSQPPAEHLERGCPACLIRPVVRQQRLHPGMTIAEYVAQTGAAMEVVTPERILAPDIGSTNYPAYIRALNNAGAKITSTCGWNASSGGVTRSRRSSSTSTPSARSRRRPTRSWSSTGPRRSTSSTSISGTIRSTGARWTIEPWSPESPSRVQQSRRQLPSLPDRGCGRQPQHPRRDPGRLPSDGVHVSLHVVHRISI